MALDLNAQNDVTAESHDAAIDALLLAVECYINPYFMLSFGGSPKLMDHLNVKGSKVSQSFGIVELKRSFGKSKRNLETTHLERKREKLVLQILLEATKMDRKYHARVSNGEECPYSDEGVDEYIIVLSSLHIQSADAIILARQNQVLFCNFLIQQLHREQNSMHGILMQSVIYILHTTTKLYYPSELVINITLKYAEVLNRMMLLSLYHQMRKGSLNLAPERIKRRWILLQRLVITTKNGDEEPKFGSNILSKNQCGNLIPSSTWTSILSGSLIDAIQGASKPGNIPVAFINVILFPIIGNVT